MIDDLINYRAAFAFLYPARWQAAKDAGNANGTATTLYRWLERLIAGGCLQPVVQGDRRYLRRIEVERLAADLKTCDRCHVPQPLGEFHKNRARTKPHDRGHDHLCKRCRQLDYRKHKRTRVMRQRNYRLRTQDSAWLPLAVVREMLGNVSNSWVSNLAQRGLIEGRGERGSREYSRASIEAYITQRDAPKLPKPPRERKPK